MIKREKVRVKENESERARAKIYKFQQSKQTENNKSEGYINNL